MELRVEGEAVDVEGEAVGVEGEAVWLRETLWSLGRNCGC